MFISIRAEQGRQSLPIACQSLLKAICSIMAPAHKITYNSVEPANGGATAGTVVYFPSCITRSIGVSKSYCNEVEITRLTEKLLLKAGYKVVYPDNLNKLCCGMAFSSKGYVEAGKKASGDLEAALMKASENGKYPVLCDMSPCKDAPFPG